MSELEDLDRARRARLVDQDNQDTTPADALRLALDHVAETPGIDNAVVILERPEGGAVLFTTGTTYAESVFLLESGKISLMLGEG